MDGKYVVSPHKRVWSPCLRCADGWVGRWAGGRQAGAQKPARAGCKMDGEEGVSTQYSCDCSKQRRRYRAMKTNICLQQAHDSTSICTHTTPPPPPPPPSIINSLTASTSCYPQSRLPAICLGQGGFSSFVFFPQHSGCFLPRSAASAVESAERRGSAC